MYVDYQYYVEEYDGTVPEEEFTKMNRQAQAYVDFQTKHRIQELTDKISNPVKHAVCAAIDVYHEYWKKAFANEGRQVKSENTDGYSVSYATEMKDGETLEEVRDRKLYAAIRIHLLHTGLLYRGYDHDHEF